MNRTEQLTLWLAGFTGAATAGLCTFPLAALVVACIAAALWLHWLGED